MIVRAKMWGARRLFVANQQLGSKVCDKKGAFSCHEVPC